MELQTCVQLSNVCLYDISIYSIWGGGVSTDFVSKWPPEMEANTNNMHIPNGPLHVNIFICAIHTYIYIMLIGLFILSYGNNNYFNLIHCPKWQPFYPNNGSLSFNIKCKISQILLRILFGIV